MVKTITNHLALSKRLYPDAEWRAWTIKRVQKLRPDGTVEDSNIVVSGGDDYAQTILINELRKRHAFVVENYRQGRLAIG